MKTLIEELQSPLVRDFFSPREIVAMRLRSESTGRGNKAKRRITRIVRQQMLDSRFSSDFGRLVNAMC
jgi:hypothetical protein